MGSEAVALVRRLVAVDPEEPAALAEACALAVGHRRMVGLAGAAKREGEWMVAALLYVALSLPSRSGVWLKAEEKPLLSQAQALLQGKMDGDVGAMLLELSVLRQGYFVGLYHLSDGTEWNERAEVLRQRKADLGLGVGSKTLKDVGNESMVLFYKIFPILKIVSMEPEHRVTVPSAADFEEGCRLLMESMAPLQACRRGGCAEG